MRIKWAAQNHDLAGLGEYIAIYSHLFRILAVAKLVPRMHTSCPTGRAKVFLQLEHVFSSKKDICLRLCGI